jgi:very-short-patch-repair endonuclease
MLDDVDVRLELARLGGVAVRGELVAVTSRADVDRALRSGEVVRVARGRYALPVVDDAVGVAHALGGAVSHLSAALHWGWEVKTPARLPDVTVPRHRRLPPGPPGATLHWADLSADELAGPVTTPRRTLVDCLRHLPFDEALAVADSALRHESLDQDMLAEMAAAVRGPGSAAARRVAAHASGLAANPFESVLRAIAVDVRGLRLAPQVPVRAPGFWVQPDLVDEERRVVVEADSFAWHGDRRALREDARRYNNLVVRGWRVLRFAWEDVMHDPSYVRSTLEALQD